MKGYQFISVNSYSSARPKARTRSGKLTGTTSRKLNSCDVFDEVTRVPSACKHVDNPQPPNWLLGSREEAETAGAQWKATTRHGKRKVRTDSPWLAAGVASLPKSRISEWPAFRDDVVKHLRKKYGNRLKGVVEHLDEEHPHLHFYCVPNPGDSFGTVHQGFAAKTAARKAGRHDVGTAYSAQMRNYQDEFFEAVGKPWGLDRIGLNKGRRTRAKWKADKAEAEALLAEQKLVDIRRTTDRLLHSTNVEAKTAIEHAGYQALSIVEQAKVKAHAVIKTEEERIRKSGTNYLKRCRAMIREERHQLEVDAVKFQELNARLAVRADELQQTYKDLRSTSVYHQLDDMRFALDRATNALALGKLGEAELALKNARSSDPAPRALGPKVSPFSPRQP